MKIKLIIFLSFLTICSVKAMEEGIVDLDPILIAAYNEQDLGFTPQIDDDSDPFGFDEILRECMNEINPPITEQKESKKRKRSQVSNNTAHACYSCDEKFSSYTTLHNHINTQHLGKEYICPTCSKKYESPRGLELHTKSKHLGMKFVCRCGKEYATKKSFKNHIKAEHLNKRYKCPTCDKEYIQKENLAQHIKSVHEGQKYQCNWDGCDKKFDSKKSLDVHINASHLNKKNVCDKCSKEYSYPAGLARHIKKKHTYNQEQPEQIEETANIQSSFESDYPCPTCDKRYKSFKALFEHKKIKHFGETYKCVHCNKDYKSRAGLNDHLKKKHAEA